MKDKWDRLFPFISIWIRRQAMRGVLWSGLMLLVLAGCGESATIPMTGQVPIRTGCRERRLPLTSPAITIRSIPS